MSAFLVLLAVSLLPLSLGMVKPTAEVVDYLRSEADPPADSEYVRRYNKRKTTSGVRLFRLRCCIWGLQLLLLLGAAAVALVEQ